MGILTILVIGYSYRFLFWIRWRQDLTTLMMRKGDFNTTLLLFISTMFLLVSCGKEDPHPTIIKPGPEPAVLFECPQDGDVYKMIIDTIIVNSKGDLYTAYGSKIHYAASAIPLGICAKTADLYGTAKYSPLSAIVKTEQGKSREMIWDRNGYFKDLILQEDIQRIVAFQEGRKVVFELSLLNFNKDIIQTSPIVLIYREKFLGK